MSSTGEPTSDRLPSDANYDAVAETPSDLAADRSLRIGYDREIEPVPAGRGAGDGRPAPKARKMRKFIFMLFVLGIAWTAWAAGALYDLWLGLQHADPIALERRIDWTSVRQALHDDLGAGRNGAGGERTLDDLLSRQSIANLLRTAKLDRHEQTAAQSEPGAASEQPFGWHRVRYAFFSGSPFALRIDVAADSDPIGRPMVLFFRWTGDWRLVRIFLPSDPATVPATQAQTDMPPPNVPAVIPPAPQVAAPAPAPQAAAPEPAAATATPAPTPPVVTHRAVLYEEGSGSQGKRYNGTAVWRTEQAPALAGGSSELAVTAHITIPERKFGMTMALRRNLDQSLPASHMIEIKFDLPGDPASHGIEDVVGIMMKPDSEKPGQKLAGSRVKVRDDFFLFAMSAIELDMRHNMQVLKERPWLGIPFRFANGTRAVLAIEKGATGNKSLAEGFARWSATAAGAAAATKPRP
jgi:hypothetical protein